MNARETGRRSAFALMLCMLIGGIAAAGGDAAQAAPVDGVEFSTDGGTWSAEPPVALFDAGFIYAPGDQRSSTVLVRNAHGSPIRISAALTGLSWSDPDAGTGFTIAGADQDGVGLIARPVASIVDCTPLVPARVLAAGESIRITTTVELLASVAGTAAQGSSVAFSVALRMTDAAVPAPTTGCGSGAPGGPGVVVPSLPGTAGGVGGALGSTGLGEHVAPSLLVAGLAGLLGLLLVAVSRRRRARRDAELDEAAPAEPAREG